MAYDDKDFLTFFPTRQGGAQGAAAERMMIDSVGGAMSIRTRIRSNPDGSTTMLKTRGGMPEFTTTPADVVEEEPVHPCDHGLYFDGTDNYGERYAGGPYGIYATGGMLFRTSDNKVVDIAGPKPVWGDAYTLDTDMFSGEYGRFCALETGEMTWAFDWQGVPYYVIASATTISFYIDPSLEAQYHRGTMVVSTPTAGYATAYPSHPRVHAVADVNSTGQRFIIESYGPPPTAAAGDNEVAHQNRFRVCRPNHLIAAVECWVVPYNNDGTLYFTVEWRDLVVFTDLYTVPVIIEPAIANIPLRPIQTRQDAYAGGEAAVVSGSLPTGVATSRLYTDGVLTSEETHPYTLWFMLVKNGYSPLIEVIDGGPLLTFAGGISEKVKILGAKYKHDEICFVYSKHIETTEGSSFSFNGTSFTRTLTTYRVNGSVVSSTDVVTNGNNGVCGSAVIREKLGVEIIESIGGVVASAAEFRVLDRPLTYTIDPNESYGLRLQAGLGDGSETLEPPSALPFVVRPSNKVFGVVGFAGASLGLSPYDHYGPVTATVEKLRGTSKALDAQGVVFAGTLGYVNFNLPINERSPMESAISPYIYTSEHPVTEVLAAGVGLGKSVCWV